MTYDQVKQVVFENLEVVRCDNCNRVHVLPLASGMDEMAEVEVRCACLRINVYFVADDRESWAAAYSYGDNLLKPMHYHMSVAKVAAQRLQRKWEHHPEASTWIGLKVSP